MATPNVPDALLGSAAAPVRLAPVVREGQITIIQAVEHPETTTALYRQRLLAEALEGSPLRLTPANADAGTVNPSARRRR